MLSRTSVCSLSILLGNISRQYRIRNFGEQLNNASTLIPAAVEYPTLFNSFAPHFAEDPRIGKQVASFERAVKQKVSDSIDVIRTDSPIEGIGCALCPHLIFVRRRIHDALLTAIRKRLHAVVVGNPGIGKSVFQQYYLARIFNEQLFGPLPDDYFGNTNPPEVVVRQIGASLTELYFVPERKYVIFQRSPEVLLRAFKPERTLLLFEPGHDVCEPVWSPQIPTSAYVSPSSSRYKEFVKRGARKLYNPVWDLDEILCVAEIMRSESSFPDAMQSFYKDAEVEKRFKEFGGIFRYCLPQHPEVLLDARGKRKEALQEAGRSSLIRFETIEHPEVSHHLAHFEVDVTGPDPFGKATIDLVNDNVENELKREWLLVSLLDKIRALMRNDETGYMDKACQDLFEDVLAEVLMRKVAWRQRVVVGGHVAREDGVLFSSGYLLRRIDGIVPKFEDMDERVLYVPLKRNFPLADMVWRCGDLLFMANAARQNSGSKRVAGVEAFVNELCVPHGLKVCLYIVPKHDMFTRLNVEVPLTARKLVNLEVVILEMPKDYGASTFGY